MSNNGALNSHFHGIDPIILDAPDEIYTGRSDLIISSLQADLSSGDAFIWAATIRNIGDEKAVIPATRAGGTVTFTVLHVTGAHNVGFSVAGSLTINTDAQTPIEVEPGEEFVRTWAVLAGLEEYKQKHVQYLMADLLPDLGRPVLSPDVRIEDFIRLGNNVAITPIIKR